MDRNRSLDGLRGLAALAVAMGHCNTVVTGVDVWAKMFRQFGRMDGADIAARLWHSFFPADAAVIVFFVLSGYVLGKSLEQRQRSIGSAAAFGVRRLFRLYPANLVWSGFTGTAVYGATVAATIPTMLLLSYSAHPVVWSLQIELAGSALVLLFWLLRVNWIVAVVLGLAAWWVNANLSPNMLLLFLPAVAAGYAIVALPRPWLPRTIFWVGLFFVFFSDLFVGKGATGRYLEVLGASLTVWSLAHIGWKPLETRPVQFLGKVSYSFYLTHTAALVWAQAVVPPLDGWLGRVVVLVVVSVPPALAVAYLSYRFIEAPGIALGARVTSRLTKRGLPRGSKL